MICWYMQHVHLPGTKCVAFFDENHSTICCGDCELLIHIDSHAIYDVPCCSRCWNYCNNLRALVSRSEKQRESDSTDPSSHTPFRHLSSPEKFCYVRSIFYGVARAHACAIARLKGVILIGESLLYRLVQEPSSYGRSWTEIWRQVQVQYT